VKGKCAEHYPKVKGRDQKFHDFINDPLFEAALARERLTLMRAESVVVDS
jgi:hypothetical protein